MRAKVWRAMMIWLGAVLSGVLKVMWAFIQCARVAMMIAIGLWILMIDRRGRVVALIRWMY